MNEPETLAYQLRDAARVIGLSRAKLYQLFKTGELRSFTVGRRRLVARKDLEHYVDRKTGEELAT